MNTVQYGDWKIAVDIDRTKEYYNTYEKNDNQANNDCLPFLFNAHNSEPISQHAHNKSANDGAGDGALPAGKGSATNDNGGNGFKLVALPQGRLG